MILSISLYTFLSRMFDLIVDFASFESLTMKLISKSCKCPKCNRTTDKFHDTYNRKVQDLLMYWSSILVTLCSKNSLYISCFKRCHPIVVRMRSDMVVPNIYILYCRIIQCFRIHKMIPIYQFSLKCFIKPLHGCIIIRTPCFTHALDNPPDLQKSTNVQEVNWHPWSLCKIKPAPVFSLLIALLSVSTASSVFRWAEFNDAATERSYRSIVVQLYRMKEFCKERNNLYEKQNELKGQKQKIEKSLER